MIGTAAILAAIAPRSIGPLPPTNRKPKTNRADAATLTARTLATSGLVGIWADRTDLPDSPEYARQLHHLAEYR